MTQEEKELLLKDLSARLPCKVKCEFRYKEKDYINLHGFAIPVLKINTDTGETEYKTENRTLDITDLEAFSDGDLEIKPYLRPLSSMTEEEVKELVKVHIIGKYGPSSDYSNIFFIDSISLLLNTWSACVHFKNRYGDIR